MEYSFRLQLTTNGISIKSLIYIHELYACLLIVIPIIPFSECNIMLTWFSGMLVDRFKNY